MKLILKILIGLAVIAVAVILSKFVDVNKILEAGSLAVLALILVAETGLLVGFFLPGDTLLFAAGFFAAQGRISLAWALIVLFLGTFIGNIIGYEFGKRTGKKIFKNEEALLFSKDNIIRAEEFYKKHGGKTILIARFIPIVRTIVPPLAGMGRMDYKLFMTYNLVGAFLWVGSVTLIGYWAGKTLGHYINIDNYILPVVLFATVVTFGGSAWHILKDEKARYQFKKTIKQKLKNVF
jgi:membrane-associated protein